jgi:hypothetical protein
MVPFDDLPAAIGGRFEAPDGSATGSDDGAFATAGLCPHPGLARAAR